MKKKFLIILVSVAAIPLGLALLYLGGLLWAHDFNPHFLHIDSCLDSGGRWDYLKNECVTFSAREQKRLISPDGIVDAVLLKTDAGATTSFAYSIHIVPKGRAPIRDHECFVADHVKNLEVSWVQSNLLEISYSQARIFKFTNFWHSREVQDFAYVVELKLNHKEPGFALSNKDRWLEM